MLVVIDGSKGIYKAVQDVFGKKAVVQRCQWHKRENVLSYLSDRDKSNYKTKIQNAYRGRIITSKINFDEYPSGLIKNQSKMQQTPCWKGWKKH
ncbi:MAG: transposase [Bacteroidia bacterium]